MLSFLLTSRSNPFVTCLLSGSCFPYAKKKMEMGTPYGALDRRGRGGDESGVSDQAEIARGTPVLSAITRTPSISMVTQIDLVEKRGSAKFGELTFDYSFNAFG